MELLKDIKKEMIIFVLLLKFFRLMKYLLFISLSGKSNSFLLRILLFLNVVKLELKYLKLFYVKYI